MQLITQTPPPPPPPIIVTRSIATHWGVWPQPPPGQVSGRPLTVSGDPRALQSGVTIDMGRHSRPVCAPGSPPRTRWGTDAPKRGYPHKNTILPGPESWWRQWNKSEVLRFGFEKYVVIIFEAGRCAHPPYYPPYNVIPGANVPGLSAGFLLAEFAGEPIRPCGGYSPAQPLQWRHSGTLPEDTLPLPYWIWNVQAGDVGMEPHCPPEAVVSQSGDQVPSYRKI